MLFQEDTNTDQGGMPTGDQNEEGGEGTDEGTEAAASTEGETEATA